MLLENLNFKYKTFKFKIFNHFPSRKGGIKSRPLKNLWLVFQILVQILGLGQEVDFNIAFDSNSNNNNNNDKNPQLNFLRGTVLGAKGQGVGIRDKGYAISDKG